MIVTDCHLHTAFSTDSNCDMPKIINSAIAKGLHAICITDHMDYDFPQIGIEGKNGFPPFSFDVNRYLECIGKSKELYADKIDLLQGIELGLKTNLKPRYLELTQNHAFDYVIGSIHLIDDQDPYYPQYWLDQDVHSAIARYFEVTLENVQQNMDFDALGHLDYVVRYAPNHNGFSYNPSEYRELIEEILKCLVLQGKALEINTSGYRKSLCAPNPNAEILSWYRDLGGELLTIGSDAHDADVVAYGFESCEAMIKACGYQQYHIYRNRKPCVVELS